MRYSSAHSARFSTCRQPAPPQKLFIAPNHCYHHTRSYHLAFSFLPPHISVALHMLCKGYQQPAEISWRKRHERWKSCSGSPVRPFPARAVGDRVRAHAIPSTSVNERRLGGSCTLFAILVLLAGSLTCLKVGS